MSILVTGATGQFGKLVLNHLLNKVPASEIIVSVRNPEKADFLSKQGVAVRQGDFNNSESLDKAFEGASKILIISISEPNPLVRIRQQLNAVEAAKKAEVKQIVFAGTGKAFPEKIVPTVSALRAYSHQATEQAILATEIPYTFLRNGFFLEGFINSQLLKNAAEHCEFISATGNGPLNFASYSDYALAAAVVLTESGHENKTYELTSNNLWSFADVAEIASKISGRKILHRAVTAAELKEIYVKSGMPEFIAENITKIHTDIANGVFGVVSSDLSNLIGTSLTSLQKSVEKALQV
ncbi:SDR family oxidoreductase [Paradesulfitobacterium aromaticivorans]